MLASSFTSSTSAGCRGLPKRNVSERPGSRPSRRLLCVSAGASSGATVSPLEFKVEIRKKHATGVLEVLTLDELGIDACHPPLPKGANKPPRRLRFWLPPGHSKDSAPAGGYPVICLNDGQNLFGDGSGSLLGSNWQAGRTVSRLIEERRIPPCVVVSIDHAGSWRSFDYLPYPPGAGVGGLRAEAASWPGGGVAAYTDTVLRQVLPLAVARYGTADGDRRVFGGSSFGGICSLWMAMLHEGAFGGVLVESPSFWMADGQAYSVLIGIPGRNTRDVLAYEGPWPERVFVAMGSEEYGAKALAGRGPELDRHLLKTAEGLSSRLRERGLGPDRHAYVIGKGARHDEAAWAARLPAALEFLCGGWR